MVEFAPHEGLVVWDKWYQEAGRTAYEAGQHIRRTPVGSYAVQEGFRVKFYPGEGVDGHTHPWQYCRDVPEAKFYPYLAHGGPVTIVVEKTDIPSAHVAKLGWRQRWSNGGIDLYEMVAPTSAVWEFPGNFPNDLLEWIDVPETGQLTLYVAGGGQGTHLAYSGGRHQLEGVFWHTVSSVELALDDYEVVAVEYDWDHREVLESKDRIGGSNTAYNHSDLQQSIGVDISVAEGTESGWHWNVGASVGLTVEVSAGVKPFGIGADAKIAASVTASSEYGQTGSTSNVETQSHSLEADVPANSKMDVSMVVHRESARCPCKSTLRNKRTGAEFKETGKVTITNLSRGETVFGEPVAI